MLSVLVTCYNQADIILKTLDSIVSQKKLEDFEIVVSDDLSTDDSMKVLNEYAKNFDNIKIVQPKIKKRVGNNRNTLLDNFSGEYCCFIDGDDIQEDGYVLAIQKAIKSKKQVYRIKNFKEIWEDNNIIKDSLFYENFMLFVYSKEFLKDKRINVDLEIGEDVEFSYRFFSELNSEINIIDTCYCLNRRDDNISLTKNGDFTKRYDQEKILLDHIILYENNSQEVSARINQKKIDVINIAILADSEIPKLKVKLTKVRKKHVVSYLMYRSLTMCGLKKVYILLVKKKLGHKI